MRTCETTRLAVLLMAALAAWCACAEDTLALKSGEILSGELKELSEGVVVFRTKLTGQVFLPAEEVRGIATAEPWEIVGNADAPLCGRLRYSGEEVYVDPLEGGAPQPVDLAGVESARLLPASHASSGDVEEAGALSAWELSAGAGYYGRLGVRDYGDPFVTVLVKRAEERWDFASRFRVGLGGSSDWPQYFTARNELRLHHDEHYYGLTALDLERDTDIGLSIRSDLSAAAGREFFLDSAHELRGDTGVMVSAERFNASRLPIAVRPGLGGLRSGWGFDDWKSTAYYTYGKRSRQHTGVSWRFRLLYKRDVPFDGLFTKDLAVYPSLTDVGELRARSESTLQFPLTSHLNVRFELLLDYQRTPEFSRVDPWRTTVGAGVVFDF
ncbi:MAG: DUF481 domain-containing protein [Candidatus Hydrogenedentota bacterium]